MISDKSRIYGLRGKDTSRYFYVGSTKHSLKWRLQKHREHVASGNNRNLHLTRTIRLIGIDNIRIDLIEEVDHAQRFDREAYWISLLPGLTNIVKNPSTPITHGISCDQIERVWRSVRDQVDPRLQSTLTGHVEAVVNTLRAIEQELSLSGQPLVFSV